MVIEEGVLSPIEIRDLVGKNLRLVINQLIDRVRKEDWSQFSTTKAFGQYLKALIVEGGEQFLSLHRQYSDGEIFNQAEAVNISIQYLIEESSRMLVSQALPPDLDREDFFRTLFEKAKEFGEIWQDRIFEPKEEKRSYVFVSLAELQELGLIEKVRGKWKVVDSLDVEYLDPNHGEVKINLPLNMEMEDPVRGSIPIYWGEGSIRVAYKGGFARLFLKLWMLKRGYVDGICDDTDPYVKWRLVKSILSELPLADRDAIVSGVKDEQLVSLALDMGVDAKDLEVGEYVWEEGGIEKYCDRRDLVPNMSLFIAGQEDELAGFYFDPAAIECIIAGRSDINADRSSDLFGIYSFVFSNSEREYITGKALARMMGMIIKTPKLFNGELVWASKLEKIVFKEHQIPGNLGMFWMVLVRKYIEKKDAPIRIIQLYQLAKLLAQDKVEVKKGKEIVESFVPSNAVEWIRGLQRMYPQFSFHSITSNEKLCRWIIEKVLLLFFRYLRKTHALYSLDRDLDRSEIREISVNVEELKQQIWDFALIQEIKEEFEKMLVK